MRIAIVTTGRFHLLDLARELAVAGHEVSFHSCVSRRRAIDAGLPAGCHRAPLRLALPLVLAQRRGPEAWQQLLRPALDRLLDRAAARSLAPCDVLVALSGVCVRAIERARGRFGATVFLERGTRHVLSEKAILEEIPGARRPAIAHAELKREIWGYGRADVVVVAARHAAESFAVRGVPPERLFLNPYGVDLQDFVPTTRPRMDTPTVLYVGRWSLRKGCDVLAKAVEGRRWRLVHVGPMGDAPRPKVLLYEQREALRSWELRQVFRAADICVVPSRVDSFNTTQVQALASGLPVVCTERTGGEDVRELLEEPEWVTVVPAGNLEALQAGIVQALARAAGQTGLRQILGASRDRLTWRAYGQRYHAELQRRRAGKSAEAVDPVGDTGNHRLVAGNLAHQL